MRMKKRTRFQVTPPSDFYFDFLFLFLISRSSGPFRGVRWEIPHKKKVRARLTPSNRAPRAARCSFGTARRREQIADGWHSHPSNVFCPENIYFGLFLWITCERTTRRRRVVRSHVRGQPPSDFGVLRQIPRNKIRITPHAQGIRTSTFFGSSRRLFRLRFRTRARAPRRCRRCDAMRCGAVRRARHTARVPSQSPGGADPPAASRGGGGARRRREGPGAAGA